MSRLHFARRTLARPAAAVLGAALVAAAARPAEAQGRVLFSWAGSVDRQASLVMRGGRVTSPIPAWGASSPRGDLRVNSPLPEADGVVRVRVERGRGAVEVTE